MCLCVYMNVCACVFVCVRNKLTHHLHRTTPISDTSEPAFGACIYFRLVKTGR